MGKVHVLHIAEIVHKDKDGNVLWREENLKNVLHDEGEMYLLARAFATGMATYGAGFATLYMGLDNRSTPLESDTLGNTNGEPFSGNGYSRQPLSTTGTGLSGQDFYINQPAGFYRADTKVVTFTCTSTWNAVKQMFLCSAASGSSGIMICSVALSQERTLNTGDSLQASIYIGLSE